MPRLFSGAVSFLMRFYQDCRAGAALVMSASTLLRSIDGKIRL
jgi:hypothetical protein